MIRYGYSIALYYFFTAIGVLGPPPWAINPKLGKKYANAICGFEKVPYTKVAFEMPK